MSDIKLNETCPADMTAENSRSAGEVDALLADSDMDKLANISGSPGLQASTPQFYNCFSSTFINSPNFRKSLTR